MTLDGLNIRFSRGFESVWGLPTAVSGCNRGATGAGLSRGNSPEWNPGSPRRTGWWKWRVKPRLASKRSLNPRRPKILATAQEPLDILRVFIKRKKKKKKTPLLFDDSMLRTYQWPRGMRKCTAQVVIFVCTHPRSPRLCSPTRTQVIMTSIHHAQTVQMGITIEDLHLESRRELKMRINNDSLTELSHILKKRRNVCCIR